MYENIDDFIDKYATGEDACYYCDDYPADIRKMLKNIYSCCFRFCMYPSQTLFMLNKALEPFRKSESLLFADVRRCSE